VLGAAVLAAGAWVALYRWGPDLRVAFLGFPLVVPSLVPGVPLARLADPAVGWLVAAGAVALTCLVGAGLPFARGVRGVEGVDGPPVALRHDQGRPFS